LIAKSHHWQRTAIAAAAAALLGLWGTGALALSLGRISVLSALGEPLRAEVDVPDINAEEAGSLKTTVASPEAFRAAGMDYNAAMASVQITLQKRVDGRAFLRLSSEKPVTEPFVDLILEASWATGRVVRDYTMLFDPANMRQPAVVVPTAPQISAGTQAPAAPLPAAGTTSVPRAIAPVAVKKTPTPARAETVSAPGPADGNKSVTVRSGDTASKIAAATKPASVSLDQMLVALLRANPEAFVDGNMNRIKTGAVVNVPGTEQIKAVTPESASQTVLAQSKDFNDFRRKLATNAPAAQVGQANRQSGGSVQAKVEDKKPAANVPDKLTLSKGGVQAKATEAMVAKERAEKEAAERAAELSKNIKELSKLGAASSAAAPASSAAKATADAAPKVAAAAPAAVTVPAVTPSPAPATPSATAASAPEPATKAPPAPVVKAPVVVPASPAEPGLIDQLLDNPLVPAGAGGLIALLAGFGFYRARQRKNVSQVDSAYLESRLQPDSFFGASGGQRVDTKDGGLTGSSMVYSPSQLEAADDVDPVAEADVYLAYGRDLQAEEILKEALRTNSGRIAIHQKLLEIYAKRQDLKGFETIASQAHKLTEGEGPAWERISELGLSLDPANELYQAGGEPSPVGNLSRPIPFESPSSFTNSPDTQPLTIHPTQIGGPVDLDLDLDFSLDDVASSAITETTSTRNQFAAVPAMAMPSLDLSLPGERHEAVTHPPVSHDLPALNFDLPDLDLESPEGPGHHGNAELARQAKTSFGTTEPAPLNTPIARTGSLTEPGMLEFDMGSLSLDLDDSTEGTSAAPSLENEDPLATKLALAEEFVAIGDSDGARSLIEEVIAEASGDVRSRAQHALSQLN
jgi:pilus assembly protein FimV